jgi:hypothetical protein
VTPCRISPQQLAILGWVRLNSCAPATQARFEHRDGWRLEYCGDTFTFAAWLLHSPHGDVIYICAEDWVPHPDTWATFQRAVHYVESRSNVQPIAERV